MAREGINSNRQNVMLSFKKVSSDANGTAWFVARVRKVMVRQRKTMMQMKHIPTVHYKLVVQKAADDNDSQ